jgi:UDP-N-acetylmuramoylalanine--D-glutamate ligase
VNYKEFFKNKKIAVIGIGPHGEMIADIKFLLRNKALVSLFDMRSEERIKKYVVDLPVIGLQRYSFGKIKDDELLDFDLIIISEEISKKSNYLKKAIDKGISIEFPETLFFKLIPPITMIGIMGVHGKSTVAHLVYSMLKKSFLDYEDQGLFFIDPDSTNGALTHLKKIKKGDVVLVRIPEHLLEYYYEMRISPHVAVITSVVSFKVLGFQTYNNFIVATDDVVDAIKKEIPVISKAKMLRVRSGLVPNTWNINNIFSHNAENVALAMQTAELFKVSPDIIRGVSENFIGLKGHIEFVKKINNIEFYNDSASVSPLSTLAALRSLSVDRNVVLIVGGAYTGYDYDELLKNISQYASTIVLLPGSGTIGLRLKFKKISNITVLEVANLEEAVKIAKDNAKKGDRVLFSPGFDAVGIDISRKERGERFVRAVRVL